MVLEKEEAYLPSLEVELVDWEELRDLLLGIGLTSSLFSSSSLSESRVKST